MMDIITGLAPPPARAESHRGLDESHRGLDEDESHRGLDLEPF